MTGALGQLKDLFNDPKTLESAADIAKELQDVMKDPQKMIEAQNAVKDYQDSVKNQLEIDLQDDDKIEEARLNLLADPTKAGGAEMAALFQSDEMQEVLRDPVKWKEAVMQGKGMLFSDEAK